MYDTFGSYIKKSFNLIFKNPILFIPALLNFLIGVIFIIFPIANISSLNKIKSHDFSSIALIFVIGIVMLIIQLFIYAGKSNMIKQVITVHETSMNDFWYGTRKYTGKIFLGGLLIGGAILLATLIIIVPAIFLGKNSGFTILLLILFAIAVIILSLFISFWITILVYEDCDIIESFKLSFAFAKRYLGLVFVVNLLRTILTENRNSNKKSTSEASIKFPFNKYNGIGLFDVNKYLHENPGSPIGVIALIILAIKTFLALYFDVIFFIIYHDRRKNLIDTEIL